MKDIERFVDKLIARDSKCYALIEIGKRLTELRIDSQFSDQQLNGYLDDLKSRLEHKETHGRDLASVLSCVERFRSAVHQVEDK